MNKKEQVEVLSELLNYFSGQKAMNFKHDKDFDTDLKEAFVIGVLYGVIIFGEKLHLIGKNSIRKNEFEKYIKEFGLQDISGMDKFN